MWDIGELVGHVSDWGRGETSAALDSGHLGHITVVGVGEHRDAASWESIAGGARNGRIGKVMFVDQYVRREGGNSVWRVQSSRGGHGICVGLLWQLVKESISSTKETTILEHFRAGRMKLPEVSLPRGAVLAGHLDEAVVKTEVVSDGVLPCRPAFAVVGELLDNVVADLTKRQHLVGRL